MIRGGARLHAVQRPEEIDSGRAARAKQLDNLLQPLLDWIARLSRRLLESQHHAISCGDPDGRGTSHTELPDGLPDILRRTADQLLKLRWQQRLVEQNKAAVRATLPAQRVPAAILHRLEASPEAGHPWLQFWLAAIL